MATYCTFILSVHKSVTSVSSLIPLTQLINNPYRLYTSMLCSPDCSDSHVHWYISNCRYKQTVGLLFGCFNDSKCLQVLQEMFHTGQQKLVEIVHGVKMWRTERESQQACSKCSFVHKFNKHTKHPLISKFNSLENTSNYAIYKCLWKYLHLATFAGLCTFLLGRISMQTEINGTLSLTHHRHLYCVSNNEWFVVMYSSVVYQHIVTSNRNLQVFLPRFNSFSSALLFIPLLSFNFIYCNNYIFIIRFWCEQ